MAIAMVLLYPAYLIGGGPRKSLLGFAGWVVLYVIVWVICGSLGILLIDLAMLGSSAIIILKGAMLMVFTFGGLALGAVLGAAAPQPMMLGRMTLIGGAVGGVGVLVVIAYSTRNISNPELLGYSMFALWALGPVALFYFGAFQKRSRLRKYLIGDCVRCGYGGGNRGERCSECGETPVILCGRCRRFSDRKAGEACPRCNVTLGRRCWRCQYDWKGIESDRCPECGVWKPSVGTIQ